VAGGPAVLVVDDEPGIVTVIATLLTRRGLRVRTAVNADEAKAALAEDPDIGVVLSDVQMPGQGGLALAEEILAERLETAALELVFVTSDIGPETMGTALRHRAFDFVPKPFRLGHLAAVVERACESCRARRDKAARVAAIEQGLSVARDERVRLAEKLALSMAARAEVEAALGVATRDRRNLLAVISHELRTPLIPVLGLCDVILSDPSLSRERLVEYVTHIRDGGLRLRDLVQGALDVIALDEPGSLRVLPGVHVTAVIEAAAASRATSARARGVALLATSLPTGCVTADASLLTHAVAALIDNAVKASAVDGAVVYGWAPCGDAGAAEAEIWVEDDGPGIDPDLVDRIGTPFLQGDMSETRGWGGAGLGLALASRIVARHGGTLMLGRRPTRGTRASIRLPLDLTTPEV
jgi:signal transduction histidine kinase